MCGIVGYIGEQQAAPILLAGLSKLEYRGYDSAGICVRDESTGNVKEKTVKNTRTLQRIRDLISVMYGIFYYFHICMATSSQSELRLPLLQVVSSNKYFSVGVQSPTEINAPRGRTLSGRQWFCADRNGV